MDTNWINTVLGYLSSVHPQMWSSSLLRESQRHNRLSNINIEPQFDCTGCSCINTSGLEQASAEFRGQALNVDPRHKGDVNMSPWSIDVQRSDPTVHLPIFFWNLAQPWKGLISALCLSDGTATFILQCLDKASRRSSASTRPC